MRLTTLLIAALLAALALLAATTTTVTATAAAAAAAAAADESNDNDGAKGGHWKEVVQQEEENNGGSGASSAADDVVADLVRRMKSERAASKKKPKHEKKAPKKNPQNPAGTPPKKLSDFKVKADAAPHAEDEFVAPAAAAAATKMASTTAATATRDFSKIGQPVLVFGTEGEGEGEFMSPRRVKVLPNGKYLVLDSLNSNFQIYDEDGVYEESIGEPGDELGQLMRPFDIAFLPNGTFLVVDRFNGRLQQFDGTTYEAKGEFPISACVSLAVTPDQEHFVVFETQWKQLHLYKLDGTFVKKLRWNGVTPEVFSGITFTKDGAYVLTDLQNHRVIVGTPDGKVIEKIGNVGGDKKGQLSLPYEVAVAPDGNLFVVEFGYFILLCDTFFSQPKKTKQTEMTESPSFRPRASSSTRLAKRALTRASSTGPRASSSPTTTKSSWPTRTTSEFKFSNK